MLFLVVSLFPFFQKLWIAFSKVVLCRQKLCMIVEKDRLE